MPLLSRLPTRGVGLAGTSSSSAASSRREARADCPRHPVPGGRRVSWCGGGHSGGPCSILTLSVLGDQPLSCAHELREKIPSVLQCGVTGARVPEPSVVLRNMPLGDHEDLLQGALPRIPSCLLPPPGSPPGPEPECPSHLRARRRQHGAPSSQIPHRPCPPPG